MVSFFGECCSGYTCKCPCSAEASQSHTDPVVHATAAQAATAQAAAVLQRRNSSGGPQPTHSMAAAPPPPPLGNRIMIAHRTSSTDINTKALTPHPPQSRTSTSNGSLHPNLQLPLPNSPFNGDRSLASTASNASTPNTATPQTATPMNPVVSPSGTNFGAGSSVYTYQSPPPPAQMYRDPPPWNRRSPRQSPIHPTPAAGSGIQVPPLSTEVQKVGSLAQTPRLASGDSISAATVAKPQCPMKNPLGNPVGAVFADPIAAAVENIIKESSGEGLPGSDLGMPSAKPTPYGTHSTGSATVMSLLQSSAPNCTKGNLNSGAAGEGVNDPGGQVDLNRPVASASAVNSQGKPKPFVGVSPVAGAVERHRFYFQSPTPSVVNANIGNGSNSSSQHNSGVDPVSD